MLHVARSPMSTYLQVGYLFHVIVVYLTLFSNSPGKLYLVNIACRWVLDVSLLVQEMRVVG
jgi:hypothetical protein